MRFALPPPAKSLRLTLLQPLAATSRTWNEARNSSRASVDRGTRIAGGVDHRDGRSAPPRSRNSRDDATRGLVSTSHLHERSRPHLVSLLRTVPPHRRS